MAAKRSRIGIRVDWQRGKRRRVAVLMTFATSLGVVGSACSDWDMNGEDRSMTVSTGEFTRGYRDGMREAKDSFFDDHAGWMWLWMKEKEYADGYERGWADGRRTVELSKQQKDMQERSDRESREN